MNRRLRWVALNLCRNRVRSALVILATCLAAACVSLSVGVLAGLNREFYSFVEETGAFDVTSVTSNPTSPHFIYAGALSERDGDYIRRTSPAQSVGCELIWWQFAMETDQNATRQILAGADSNALTTLRHDVVSGRGITDLDNLRHNRVIVLGQKAVKALFPNDVSVLGKHVRLAGTTFVVVGVLRKYAYYDGNDVSEMPYKNGYNFIPIRTAQEVLAGSEPRVNYIQVRATSAESIPMLQHSIRRALYLRHHWSDAYYLTTSAAQARQWSKTQASMQFGLGILSLTSLVIGATCSLNAQLSSVSERLREFGVRRSIGASRNSILLLVLLECAALSAIGGALGAVASVGIIPLVRSVIPPGFPGSPVFIWWSVPLSLVTSSLVGTLAGLWPAIKASRLDPIQAMRVV